MTWAKAAILKSSDFEWWFENRTILNQNNKMFGFRMDSEFECSVFEPLLYWPREGVIIECPLNELFHDVMTVITTETFQRPSIKNAPTSVKHHKTAPFHTDSMCQKKDLGLLRDMFRDPWDDIVACEWRSDDLKQKVFRKRHTSRSHRQFRAEKQFIKYFKQFIIIKSSYLDGWLCHEFWTFVGSNPGKVHSSKRQSPSISKTPIQGVESWGYP